MHRRHELNSLTIFLAAALVATLAFALPALGQQSARRAAPTASIDPSRHLHRSATAFGRIDLRRLRQFRHFRTIVQHGARQLDASTRAVSQVRSLLERTDTIHISLVQGPGRTAEIGTVLLHGRYGPNEVGRALQNLLPGMLQGLWSQTSIEGKLAYDVGVGALVRLSEHDWLIARRIGSDLPVAPRPPPAALAGSEFSRLSRLARFGQTAAEGILVGSPDNETSRPPPDGLGVLFHRTRAAYGHLEVGDAAEARFAFEAHNAAGARFRAEQLDDLLGRIARNVALEQGERGAPMRFAVNRRGNRVEASVALEPSQVDAYVARFLAGRLLSAAPADGATPAVARD